MIISASRRTDIPAFYTPWLVNRLRAGYCTVPNPFNPAQVSLISLRPEDIDVIVFWSRNPAPLRPHLKEFDTAGYRYYFQYTLLNYPRQIDCKTPDSAFSVRLFQELADTVGPQRVNWRYDPIVLTQLTPPAFHLESYAQLARQLRGYTKRSFISLVDDYAKTRKRWAEMAALGAKTLPEDEIHSALDNLLQEIALIAGENGMEVFSCAEPDDKMPAGIRPGKCIDDEYIYRVFGLNVTMQKDPYQRQACGCVSSKDIGMYDSCLYGCRYCYATTNFERARQNYAMHDPQSPSLLVLP